MQELNARTFVDRFIDEIDEPVTFVLQRTCSFMVEYLEKKNLRYVFTDDDLNAAKSPEIAYCFFIAPMNDKTNVKALMDETNRYCVFVIV